MNDDDSLDGQYRQISRDYDPVNHPVHYGSADDPYEAIKVIEAWELGFHLGNAVKYIARAGKKGDAIEDLRKAAWYLQRHLAQLQDAKPTAVRIVPAEPYGGAGKPVHRNID